MDAELIRQQKTYDETWRKGLESGKEQRGNLETNLAFLNQIGRPVPGQAILEIGCGIGTVVAHFAGRGFNIIGTDISKEAISYGKKKYPNARLEVQPAESLPYNNECFDVVLSFDLFEHIAEIDKHISEVYRVLKPDGYYLFQTPHKYFNSVYETLSKKSLKWKRAHPSLHTPGRLRRRLQRHGFETRFVKMNPINEFTVKKLEKFGLLGRMLARINFSRFPVFLQPNLYVVAHKI